MHTAGAADEVVNSFIPVVTALRGSVYDDVVPTKRQYQCLAIEAVLATIFPVAVYLLELGFRCYAGSFTENSMEESIL